MILTHTDGTKDLFKSQQKVSMMTLIAELPNFVSLAVLAALSGSMILILDAFESLSGIAQSSVSAILSKKLQRDDRFIYDYGMGKIEALGSLTSSLLLFIGLIIVFAVSVRTIIIPVEPGGILIFAIIVKTVNVTVDIYLMVKQQKSVGRSQSSFIKSNVLFLRRSLIFDSAALFTVTFSYLLSNFEFIVYLDPIMCIICAMYIAILNVGITRDATEQLLDKTLDENAQLEILKCITFWDDIKEFSGIRTRRCGHITYIDLMVSFHDDCTYTRIYKAFESFDSAVKKSFPGCVSGIVIGGEQSEENSAKQTISPL